MEHHLKRQPLRQKPISLPQGKFRLVKWHSSVTPNKIRDPIRDCPFLPQIITSSQKDTVNESMVSHFNAERKQEIEVSGSVSGEARICVIRGKPTTHNPQNTRKPLRGTLKTLNFKLKTLNFKVPVHTFRVFCDGRRPFCVFCGQSPPIKGIGTTDGTDTHFARHRCTRLCERSALCGPHDLITRR